MLAGLSIAGCAPTLQGAGADGGTIRQNQFTQNNVELGPLDVGPLGLGDTNVLMMAGKYCSQYGRSAHITTQEVRAIWPYDTFTFDCVE